MRKGRSRFGTRTMRSARPGTLANVSAAVLTSTWSAGGGLWRVSRMGRFPRCGPCVRPARWWPGCARAGAGTPSPLAGTTNSSLSRRYAARLTAGKSASRARTDGQPCCGLSWTPGYGDRPAACDAHRQATGRSRTAAPRAAAAMTGIKRFTPVHHARRSLRQGLGRVAP